MKHLGNARDDHETINRRARPRARPREPDLMDSTRLSHLVFLSHFHAHDAAFPLLQDKELSLRMQASNHNEAEVAFQD